MAMGMDPIADLLTLQRDMDRVMERFGGQPRRAEDDGHAFWMPSVDVFQQGEDMIVRAEIPGVAPSDVSVSVTGNMLTVRGERRQDERVQEGGYVLRESRYGAFERRVTMPGDIDAAKVRAQYRSGVLEVTVPRSALVTPQPQNVQVSAAQPRMEGGRQQMQQTETQPYAPTSPAAPTSFGEMGGAGYRQEQPPVQETYLQGSAPGGQQGYQQQQPYGQEQAPQGPQVQAEGGWAAPEQQGQQQASAMQTSPQAQQAQTPPAEEEKSRSRLGGWLHGSQ